MNAIEATFKNLERKGQRAFIPYITCGDPSPDETSKVMEILQKNGADIIELGIPHSDPVADGKTIQASVQRALENGTTPETVLSVLEGARGKCDIPVVLLTYYNIVLQYGIEEFVSDFSSFSEGLIVADLPPEESEGLVRCSKKYDFSNIFLASPITPEKRLERILEATSGFLYVVSLLGVTGERERVSREIHDFMMRGINHKKIPLCVGFGISKPEHVSEILDLGADGVIVGSGIVSRANDASKLEAYVCEMSAPTKNRKIYIGEDSRRET